jgi:uncharacterized protein (DUF302 family)
VNDGRAIIAELITVRCADGVPRVVAAIARALERRGVGLFATIDHAGGARDTGLQLPDEVLLVLGNPAVGTALMQADPRTGLDLPLRMLIWSESGTTTIGYRDPGLLAEDHELAGMDAILDRLRGLLQSLTAEVAG